MIPSVSLRGLSKRYGTGKPALEDVDLEIAASESVAVVGPSGSGKTTLLRLVAGLERPGAGEVWLGGKLVNDVPTWKRRVALVTQTPVLLPHQSVLKNLSRGAGSPAAAPGELAELAERLQIDGLLNRRPHQISGGERQRVALARAIHSRAPLLMLDEPLASLDTGLRGELRAFLQAARDRWQPTTLIVTQDLVDALTLARRLVVLIEGRVVDQGPAEAVYRAPASLQSARFLGDPPMNLLPCRWTSRGGELSVVVEGLIDRSRRVVATAEADVAAVAEARGFLGFRAHHARDAAQGSTGRNAARLTLPARPCGAEHRGSHSLLRVGAGGTLVWVESVPFVTKDQSGVRLEIDLDHCVVYDAESGRRLATGLRAVGDDRA